MIEQHDPPSSTTEAERIFTEFLERHEAQGADPDTLFAAHPRLAPLLRRWWERLSACGEVAPAPVRAGDADARRIGPYRLLAELGRGAQGTVHLAEDTRLGRRVALKLLPAHRMLSPAAQHRFRREAELVARIDHAGVCTIYEAGEDRGTAFIAMRYVAGETLAERLGRAGPGGEPLSVGEAIAICSEVAAVLQVAHDQQLVHRDIKPGNIMLTRDGRPVILDFGLARHTEDEASVTLTGDLVGTPAYMAPEQLAGQRIPIDGRTDVYSLGVVLFECLTLARPFAAPTHAALYEQILTAPLPDVRACNPAVGRDLAVVLATALARDRRLRYQSAADLAEDLRRCQRGAPIRARAPSLLQRARSWTRQHPTLATTLALSLVLMVVGTAAWLALYRAQQALTQLADMATLREAVWEEEAELYPPVPALVERCSLWLDTRARPLAQRLPAYRERLARLAAHGTRSTVARPAADAELARIDRLRAEIDALRLRVDRAPHRLRRDEELFSIARLEEEIARAGLADTSVVFADPGQRVEYQTLHQLVHGIEQLLAPGGAAARVADQLAFARDVVRRSVTEHGPAWDAARALVRQSARYGRRELAVQVGLVPLGPDPESGLLEFAHLRSGVPPQRDPQGRLLLTPDSALVLVLIPGGRARVGASKDDDGARRDADAEADEAPPGEVDLDWFFLGKHELPRGAWRRLGGGSLEPVEPAPRSDLAPVAHVTWHAAERLLRREGLALPTEAQWELALRAGTNTPYFVVGGAEAMAAHVHGRVVASGEFPEAAALIASHAANGFGLHHMAGNLLEWCRDAYYGAGPAGFAHAPGDGERMLADTGRRVVRGGSFRSPNATAFRSAWRSFRAPNEHRHDLGLRAARRVDP